MLAGLITGFMSKKDDNKTAKKIAEMQEETKRKEIAVLEKLAMKDQQGENFAGGGVNGDGPPPMIHAHNTTYVVQGVPHREFHRSHYRGPQVYPSNGYVG